MLASLSAASGAGLLLQALITPAVMVFGVLLGHWLTMNRAQSERRVARIEDQFQRLREAYANLLAASDRYFAVNNTLQYGHALMVSSAEEDGRIPSEDSRHDAQDLVKDAQRRRRKAYDDLTGAFAMLLLLEHESTRRERMAEHFDKVRGIKPDLTRLEIGIRRRELLELMIEIGECLRDELESATSATKTRR
jgi:hypothetical protein